MRPISFATPTKPPRAEHPQADQPQISTPSFLISGASAKAAPSLRLDQINSQLVIQAARRVMFQALDTAPAGADPAGVVLHGNQGRLVFDLPVLLPDEHFVPIDLIRGRLGGSGRSRLRLPRKPSSPPPA